VYGRLEVTREYRHIEVHVRGRITGCASRQDHGLRRAQRAAGVPGAGEAFAASPVAADGRLLVANGDGVVYVVTAGPGLTQIAKSDMKEVVMATPAVAGGTIIVRTPGHVYGIGRQVPEAHVPGSGRVPRRRVLRRPVRRA
jgi:hypothetical protein